MTNSNGTCPPVGANIKQALLTWLGFGEIMSGEDTRKGNRQEYGKLRRAIFIFIGSDVVVSVMIPI